MKASPVCIPEWLVLINFLLCPIVCALRDRMSFPTKSDIACLMTRDLSCDGAFITRIDTICGHQGQDKSLQNETGFVTVGCSHGSTCKRTRDCRFKKSVCYGGICLCEPGLYFSPAQNRCRRKCDEYGDGMDFYKGASIQGYNDKILHNTTLTSCCDLCVREKTFTCLTVDWCSDLGKCCLSKYGYMDVFTLYREHGERNWTLAQRRCK